MLEMKEKYFAIEPAKARELLSQIKGMKAAKHGIDSRVYLIGDYAVLTTSRLKLRNVATRDDDLAYFDALIETLLGLREQGVAAVPILGYCYDPGSENGNGYIFQPRAKGEELYDDGLLKEYYAFAQKHPKRIISFRRPRAKEHILSRTYSISQAPQEHFDKFIADMIVLLDHDLLVDCNGKSNFFYDDSIGFQFIDLDAHTDYKYGLAAEKYDSREWAACDGFTPCHFAVGTRAFWRIALDERALSRLDGTEYRQLAQDNRAIFEKCTAAMLRGGITEEQVRRALEKNIRTCLVSCQKQRVCSKI